VEQEEFYSRIKIGEKIPPLEKEATLAEHEMPQIFRGIELAAESDEAQKKAENLGVDSIHTSRVFGGVTVLQFVSQMITDWLPNPRGWVQGGRISAKFIGLVRFNEIITCQGQVRDKIVQDGQKYLVCDIWVENSKGERVVVGEASISY
jgi:hypothetical protein